MLKLNKIIIFIFLLFINIQNGIYIIDTLLINPEKNEKIIYLISLFMFIISLIKFYIIYKIIFIKSNLKKFSILLISYISIFILKILLFLNIDLLLDYSVIIPSIGSIVYCGLITFFILLISYFNKYIALILILLIILYDFNKENDSKNNDFQDNKINIEAK